MLLIRRGGVPAAVTIPTVSADEPTVSDVGDAPEDVPADVRRDVPEMPSVVEPVSRPYPARVPRQRAVSEARGARASGRRQKSPERVFATEIERGELPSLRSIKARMHVGTPRAREVRDQLAAMLEALPEAA
jgi:hypothetical protein